MRGCVAGLHVESMTPDALQDVEAYLRAHAYSAMYLRAQLHNPEGRFELARERGRIVGVGTQLNNGMVVLQASTGAAALTLALVQHGRRLGGFFGPVGQVKAARHELGLALTPTLKDTDEDLFSLALDDLQLPSTDSTLSPVCRVATAADATLLVSWRCAFRESTLGDVAGPGLQLRAEADIAALLAAGSLFVLEAGGHGGALQALACCSFNARLPDMVQIGNVWTPPALRGKGYARAVVAGALRIAAAMGVVSAVLSTGRHNVAAQAAYRSIGFAVVGDYATVRFSHDVALPPGLAG
ncbi:MAG: GNAT family N-acetyltransferase [Massilia sp.]